MKKLRSLICVIVCVLMLSPRSSAIDMMTTKTSDGLDDVFALSNALSNEAQLFSMFFTENAANLDLNNKKIQQSLSSTGIVVLYVPDNNKVITLFSDKLDFVLSKGDKKAIDQAFQIRNGEPFQKALYRGMSELAYRVYNGRDLRKNDVIQRALDSRSPEPEPVPVRDIALWVCVGLIPILSVTFVVLTRKYREARQSGRNIDSARH